MGEGSISYVRAGCELDDIGSRPSPLQLAGTAIYGVLVAIILVGVGATVASRLNDNRIVGGRYG
jgi:hypothetical protein